MTKQLILFLTFFLKNSAVGETEKCDDGNFSLITTQETLERHGYCVPYDTSSITEGFPCDDLYTQNETYIYLSSLRGAAGFETYLSYFINAHLLLKFIPEQCFDILKKVECHYRFPTCGNSSVFQLPTSVCEDTCEHFRSVCFEVFNELDVYYKNNVEVFEQMGLTALNCSNTGDSLDQLKYCCTDLGIKPQSKTPVARPPNCTKANNTVPNSECVRSDSSLSESTKAVIGASIGIAFVLIATVTILISLLIKKTWNHGRGSTVSNISESCSIKAMLQNMVEEGSYVADPVHGIPLDCIRKIAGEVVVIPGRCITLMDTVGQGEFGVVYRGNLTGWSLHDGQNYVAIKTLKGVFGTSELSSMIEESIKMAKFNHPNVMRLIGVCIDKGPSPYIVMPYMSYGSLLSFLKKHRAELTLANDDDQELVNATQCKLLSMCLQVARGMLYLASQQFIHRDLAARNCMIDDKFVLKVADFGLTENTFARNYFRQTGLHGNGEGEAPVKLPVKWMAVESLHDGIFTEKTDVWSFGVTMWEIFSGGKTPYPGVDPFTLIRFLDDGVRLDKPNTAACSQEIYLLMSGCWAEDTDERPAFSDLVSSISERLKSLAGYLDLSPIWSSGDKYTT